MWHVLDWRRGLFDSQRQIKSGSVFFDAVLRCDGHPASDLAHRPRPFLLLLPVGRVDILKRSPRRRRRQGGSIALLRRRFPPCGGLLEHFAQVSYTGRTLFLDPRDGLADIRLGGRPVATQPAHLLSGQVGESSDSQLTGP